MFRYAVVVFLFCQIAVGCAQLNPDGTSSSQTDSIVSQVQQRLSTDPATARLRFGVKEDDGIVTLTGRVGSSNERLRAVSIVRATPGVRAVIDKTRQF